NAPRNGGGGVEVRRITSSLLPPGKVTVAIAASTAPRGISCSASCTSCKAAPCVAAAGSLSSASASTICLELPAAAFIAPGRFASGGGMSWPMVDDSEGTSVGEDTVPADGLAPLAAVVGDGVAAELSASTVDAKACRSTI